MSQIQFRPAGDSALNVDFGNEISETINRQVQALGSRLDLAHLPGVRETVPTFRSLLICYDPLQVSYQVLCGQVRDLTAEFLDADTSKKRIFEIPVCYGARFGADLHDGEALTGLTSDEIIRLHSSRDYRIYMLGFLPGFPYLGGMDPRLAMPRLSSPRTKIPAGSVGIGGAQTGIYPVESPGGWRLIGATPVQIYNPRRPRPILYEAGDYIRFVPISLDDYYDIHRMAGNYECRVIEEEGGAAL